MHENLVAAAWAAERNPAMVLGLCHHLAAVRPIMPSDLLPAVENLYAAAGLARAARMWPRYSTSIAPLFTERLPVNTFPRDGVVLGEVWR